MTNQLIKVQLCKNRKKVWMVSILFVSASILAFVVSFLDPNIKAPLRPGLDYTGGTQITLQRSCRDKCDSLKSNDIYSKFESINPTKDSASLALPNLNSSRIQILDDSSSILIRFPFLSPSQSDYIISNISQNFGPLIESSISIDTIGPSLGVKLFKSSLISLLVAFLSIAIYINFRYDIRYSFLALLALLHDEIIVLGVFSWLGITSSIEVDSLFAVALLTIAGYSVNNTVVVFDRIRERSRIDNDLPLAQQVDNAVSATLTRTVYTSCTTILPLVCILIWGGSSLYWFSVALSIGVIIGAWSSIALAPSLLSTTDSRIK